MLEELLFFYCLLIILIILIKHPRVCNSPKVNSKQISELLKYIRLQLDCIGVNYICINGKIVQYNKIKQMDEIAFNKLFEI